MPDFIAKQPNFTFDMDLQKGFMYDLKLNDIQIKQMDIGKRSVKVIPGEKYSTVHVDVSNVHVTAHITGGLEVGLIQAFNFTSMSINGLKFHMELGVQQNTNSSKASWELKGLSSIDFEALHINTDSVVLNSAL
jgi:hypothetical protein